MVTAILLALTASYGVQLRDSAWETSSTAINALDEAIPSLERIRAVEDARYLADAISSCTIYEMMSSARVLTVVVDLDQAKNSFQAGLVSSTSPMTCRKERTRVLESRNDPIDEQHSRSQQSQRCGTVNKLQEIGRTNKAQNL